MADNGRMRYFLLTDSKRNPFPEIVGWSQALNIRKMNRGEYQELPSSFQLNMRTGMDHILPDILVTPFLLLSEPAMHVVSFYDPEIPWCFAVLFGDSGKECASYFCPILEEEDCAVEEVYREGETVRLDRRKMKGLPLFRIRVKDRKKTVIRMDLAESLLMRHAVGLELEETIIVCDSFS